MTRIVMAYVGKLNGLDVYAAMDKEDEKALAGQKVLALDMKTGKSKRTALQNRSIHQYFTMLADALNDAGLDMIAAMAKLSRKTAIPWTPLAIKERLWRPVQQSMTSKGSSTKLETGEIGVVYEALNRATSERLGVSVSFPDRLHKLYESENYGQND